MAGLTKAQKEAKAAEAARLAAEQKLADAANADVEQKAADEAKVLALLDKAVALSGLTAPEFEALSEEDKKTWLELANEDEPATDTANDDAETAPTPPTVDLEQGAKDAAQAKADADDVEAARLAAEKEAKSKELPKSVTLVSPYGYDPEEEGKPLKMWSAGQVVTDPEDIADLIKRKAPLLEE